MNKRHIRMKVAVSVANYHNTQNPLHLWKLVDEVARYHFAVKAKIDDDFFRTVFEDLPPEALGYLVMCAKGIEKLKRKKNPTDAQRRVSQALGLIDGKRNRFREWRADQSAASLQAKEREAKQQGLKGEKRRVFVSKGEAATDQRTLKRKLARARKREEVAANALWRFREPASTGLPQPDYQDFRRALGIPKDWPGLGGKK
jgi:hypothetical protein